MEKFCRWKFIVLPPNRHYSISMEKFLTIFNVPNIQFFLLLFCVSFVSLLFIYNHHKLGTRNLPPGTSGFPLVGETLAFISSGRRGHPEKFVLDRITKYSSNIIRTHLVGSSTILFCGVEANKFLFFNENKLVHAWWPKTVDKIFPSSNKTSSMEEAKNLKRMLPSFLNLDALKSYIGVMDSVTQQHFDSDWKNLDKVVVSPLTKHYTFQIACKLFFGINDPNHVAKLEGPFTTVTQGIVSVPIDLPGTRYYRSIRAANFIRKELLAIINQRKIDLADGNVNPTKDLLSHMVLMSDENGNTLPADGIADKILGLLIGGHDSSSSICTSIVKYLAELPEVYDRVYGEQMEVLKYKGKRDLLNWEDIKMMKYSWNVASEVLRLEPPLPGAFREVLHDFRYSGFTIRKGWKIYYSIHSTHRNNDLFPDPVKFNPARFEGTGPVPFSYVPFGGGPRMCPGKEFARLEILVFMHHLVTRFKWEKVVPEEKVIFNPFPTPEHGLPIKLFRHTKA